MKSYPKVPRHDHPVVDEDVYSADDVALIEKVDGSNFRFMLYSDEYEDEYPDEVLDLNPSDGDIVFGSKSRVVGTHDVDLSEIDGNFSRAVEYLSNNVNTSAIRSLYDEEGLMVFFVENMVRHTLDYNYSDNPPPALLGFDIYAYEKDDRDEIADHPYEETFEGFLDIETAWDYFRDIGIEPLPVLKGPGRLDFDPEDFVVPLSDYGDVRAEGVVIRSDNMSRRFKKVNDEFKEMNKEAFGLRKDEAESGAEWIVAAFCTNARIRKMVRKMIQDEGREFSLQMNDDLYPRVVEDIWKEEWHELKDLDMEFNPSEIKPLVAERCINELRKMKTNAELNNRDPTELWKQQ